MMSNCAIAQLLKRVEADLSEYATVEQFPKMEGRQMVMVMAPHKNKPSSASSGRSDASPDTGKKPAAPKKASPAAVEDKLMAEAAAKVAAEEEAVRAAEAQVQAQVAAQQAADKG